MTSVVLHGIAASPGVALGPAYVVDSDSPGPARTATHGSPADESLRWRNARAGVSESLTALADRARTTVGPGEAAIFEAQAMMADDPVLEELVSQAIDGGASADEAIRQASQALQEQLLALEDAYLRQRAEDVAEVARGIERALLGKPPFGAPELPEGAIVCAESLSAGVLVSVDRAALGGLALGNGGPTSHVAILARTLGVPTVLGLGNFLQDVRNGAQVAVDAEHGVVYLAPTEAVRARLEAAVRSHVAEREELATLVELPAVSTDGVHIDIWANIGGLADVQPALAAGAGGVGLFRTEFLIAGRESLPSEDEQFALYRQVLEAMGDRPVIIRTFDVGGDKPVPALRLPVEANPFLGYRAIRIGLNHPDLLRTQLRAIARAASGGYDARIMLPMVATLEEVRLARALLDSVLVDRLERPPLGIMVEIPSAALIASALAPEVDFFSIGTNDLTQYTLAADRTDERLTGLYQPFHPAVLRLIGMTAAAARAAHIACGVCGEMAGDPRAAAVLVGLGVTELSMHAAAVGYVKRELRRTSVQSAEALANEVLSMRSSEGVLARIDAFRANSA
jgi:phosphotransferase system enzyme I (PtsI)